ncbi:MAG: YjgN family protein [Halocynthiibacter sp.]
MTTTKTEQFKFTGNAKEFFGIWIVNVLLSIVTLGIYSAWAKVRTNKYLYGNTSVAGRSFDYHATGKQIFIGRVIVVIGIIAFQILMVLPIVNILALIGLVALIPELIIRSTRFNARMTSWSNVRFGFDGKYGEAFMAYILKPIGAALTLYIAMPFASRAIHRFASNNHRLGQAKFSYDNKIGGYYKAFAIGLGLFLLIGGVIWIAIIQPAIPMMQYVSPESPEFIGMIAMFYLLMFVAILPAMIIYQVIIRNYYFAGLELDGQHQFASTLSSAKFIWIVISNLVMVICSLGLLTPFARIRLIRYMADNTHLITAGSLDEFVSTVGEQENAIGDAYTDIEGIDIGLPI